MWNDFIPWRPRKGAVKKQSKQGQPPGTFETGALNNWCWELPRGSPAGQLPVPCLGKGHELWFHAQGPHLLQYPASQVGPAGAKSAHISTTQWAHTTEGDLCLTRTGVTPSQPLTTSEVQEQVGQAGWGQTGWANLPEPASDLRSVSPCLLHCPICGNWAACLQEGRHYTR